MKTPTLCLAALLLLGACEGHNVQLTSGEDYLASYPAMSPVSLASNDAFGDDALVREVAAVEPLISFPARIGLARIANGMLTAIPEGEAEIWTKLANAHPELGEVVPVSPLIAEMAAATVIAKPREYWRRTVGDVVRAIRLGGARQHLDAVLVYEVGAQADRDFTPLAFMDLTIIGGAFLPTRSISARGVAAALLLDVRNGYPYGTANAEASLDGLSATFGSDERTARLQAEVALKAVEALAPEVEAMFGELVSRVSTRSEPAS